MVSSFSTYFVSNSPPNTITLINFLHIYHSLLIKPLLTNSFITYLPYSSLPHSLSFYIASMNLPSLNNS